VGHKQERKVLFQVGILCFVKASFSEFPPLIQDVHFL